MHDISLIDWAKKIYSCFRKCGWQKKSSPGRPQIYFLFNRFSGDILFSFLVSFALFNSCFCLFVRCSLELNMYICGLVSEKNLLSPNFRKQDYFFLALVYPIFISFLESRYVNILYRAHYVNFNSMIAITIIWNEQMKFMRNSNRQ